MKSIVRAGAVFAFALAILFLIGWMSIQFGSGFYGARWN